MTSGGIASPLLFARFSSNLECGHVGPIPRCPPVRPRALAPGLHPSIQVRWPIRTRRATYMAGDTRTPFGVCVTPKTVHKFTRNTRGHLYTDTVFKTKFSCIAPALELYVGLQTYKYNNAIRNTEGNSSLIPSCRSYTNSIYPVYLLRQPVRVVIFELGAVML